MPRVYIPFKADTSEELEIKGDTARYLNAILRVKKGESLVLFDTEGEHFEAEVLSVSRSAVKVRLIRQLGRRVEPGSGITLVMGMLKGARMDMVIQKSVELGVSAIVPVVTERTVVRETRKLERWRKIALEAARQCGRAGVPAIEAPRELPAFLESRGGNLKGVVFYEGEGLFPAVPEDVAAPAGEGIFIAVGPEGGFTRDEVDLMASKGLVPRTLGDNVLRAETAAIASLAVIQYLMVRNRKSDPEVI